MIVKAAARAGFNAASESFAESVKSTIGKKNSMKAISRATDDLPRPSLGKTLSFCPLFMKTQRMRGITIRTRAINMLTPPLLEHVIIIPRWSTCCLGTLVPILGEDTQMKKGQRGAGTRPCSGSRVIVGASQCAPTALMTGKVCLVRAARRGVQRGEAPLRFYFPSKRRSRLTLHRCQSKLPALS
jgi:hypothetical protein